MGYSEELVGRAIKGYPRDKVVIATKFGWKDGDAMTHVLDSSPARIRVVAEREVIVQRLNRLQNRNEVMLGDARTGGFDATLGEVHRNQSALSVSRHRRCRRLRVRRAERQRGPVRDAQLLRGALSLAQPDHGTRVARRRRLSRPLSGDRAVVGERVGGVRALPGVRRRDPQDPDEGAEAGGRRPHEAARHRPRHDRRARRIALVMR